MVSTDNQQASSADLQKPHEMVVMIPRSGRVTLVGRRLYNAMLRSTQATMTINGMPQADQLFEALLSDLMLAEGGKDRALAKAYLSEMKNYSVDWESTTSEEGLKWRAFSMLAQVEIERRGGVDWVRWAFPPIVLQTLADPQRWVALDLDIMASLGSYAAVALYEICARYKDNPSFRTARKPPSWWVDALSGTPPGKTPREWRKFKDEKLKVAISNINEDTDLDIVLRETRTGRSVTEVQFEVRRKWRATRPLSPFPAKPVNVALIQRAADLGIAEPQIETLIREFGDDAVGQQLHRVTIRTENKSLSAVESTFGLLRTYLRNQANKTAQNATDDAPAALGAQSGSANIPAQDDLFGAIQVVKPSEPRSPIDIMRTRAAEDSRLEARMALIRAEINSLEVDVRKHWILEAVRDLKARGVFTGADQKRAGDTTIVPGNLGSRVLVLYAEHTYGPHWRSVENLMPPA